MTLAAKLTRLNWIIIATLVPLAAGLAWMVHEQANDPADLFVDRGVTGPVAWAREIGPSIEAGPALGYLTPGQVFSIVSTFCPNAEVSYTAVSQIVAADGSPLTLPRRRNFAPGERPCGPLVATYAIPRDAPEGDYRLERSALITAPGRPTRSVALSPLALTVIALDAAAP